MITEISFTWPAGNFSHALTCYNDAREFLLWNGLCLGDFADRIAGVLNSPSHPEWTTKAEDRTVPDHLLDDPRWVTVATAATDDPRTLEHLRTIPIPVGVTRTERELPGSIARR